MGYVVDAGFTGLREGMGRMGHQDDVFVVDVARLYVRVNDCARKTDLHLVGKEHLQHLRRATRLDGHVYAGIEVVEPLHNVGQDVGADGPCRSDVQLAAGGSLGGVQGIAGVPKRFQGA